MARSPRSTRMPNLFRVEPEARRLYELYLSRLSIGRKHEAIVAACRQIRKHAKLAGGPEAGLFTYFAEFNALCKLRDYRSAWAQLRRYDREAYGRPRNLKKVRLSEVDAHLFADRYAPLLYFLKKYRRSKLLMERALAFAIRKEANSSHVLPLVYLSNSEPDWGQVTLSDIYRKLRLDLRNWSLWPKFVAQFPRWLMKRARLTEDELLAAPTHLQRVWHAIDSNRNRSSGERAARIEAFHASNAKHLAEVDARLVHYFPDLAGIPSILLTTTPLARPAQDRGL